MDVPSFMHHAHYANAIQPSSSDHALSDGFYERILAPFSEDPLGTRRLVKRIFETRGNMNLCHEYVATRVSSFVAQQGWSVNRAVFYEGDATPYPWHYNSTEPIQEQSLQHVTCTTHPIKIVIPVSYENEYAAEWKRMEPLEMRHAKQDKEDDKAWQCVRQ